MRILVQNFNNILTDVIVELKKRGHKVTENPDDYKKTDVVVIWNEIDVLGWRDWIEKARKAGNRIVLVQHGRRGTSRIFPPFNEKLVSDVVCSWGENDKDRLISCGVDPKKIVVTGTPIFKNLKPRVKHDGFNVVFSPEHWDVDVLENTIVASTLRKLKGAKVITKVLKGEHMISLYENVISSNRHMSDHFEIVAEVLSQADLIVAISESTFELCAEILDIPVIIADIWKPKACNGDDRYIDYHREYSNACTRVKDMSKMNETILYQLKHPEVLREERKRIAELDGGTNIKDSLLEICNVIEWKK